MVNYEFCATNFNSFHFSRLTFTPKLWIELYHLITMGIWQNSVYTITLKIILFVDTFDMFFLREFLCHLFGSTLGILFQVYWVSFCSLFLLLVPGLLCLSFVYYFNVWIHVCIVISKVYNYQIYVVSFL